MRFHLIYNIYLFISWIKHCWYRYCAIWWSHICNPAILLGYNLIKLQDYVAERIIQPDSLTSVVSGAQFVRYALAEGAQEKIDQKWPRQTSDHPNPEILTVNPQRKSCV
jgi:hypothetical protein